MHTLRTLCFAALVVLLAPVAVGVPSSASASDGPVDGASKRSAKKTRAESGLYVGTLGDTKLRVVMSSGFIVNAELELPDNTVIPLILAGAPNSTTLNLSMAKGSDYLRLRGEFVLPGRAQGTFTGALNRKQVKGSWHIVRN